MLTDAINAANAAADAHGLSERMPLLSDYPDLGAWVHACYEWSGGGQIVVERDGSERFVPDAEPEGVRAYWAANNAAIVRRHGGDEERRIASRLADYTRRMGADADRTLDGYEVERKGDPEPTIDEIRRKETVAHHRRKALAWVRGWSEAVITRAWKAGPRPVLSLCSRQCGTGKTHLAYGALRECAIAGLQVEVISVVRFFADWLVSNEEWRRSQLARARYADVLLLDDVGTHAGSEHELRILYDLVDARQGAHRYTIVTGNRATTEEAVGGERYGGDRAALGVTYERIVSRLAGAVVVSLEGVPDARRAR